MKSKRQAHILALIKEHDIETQSDLLEMLKKDGFPVTQATVSRDIRELRLIKTLTSSGVYKYAPETPSSEEVLSYAYLFATAIVSVSAAHNLVVIKTQNGMAQAVCAALDATERTGVLGTIAGEDTIFAATRTDAVALELAADIRKIMANKNNSFIS